MAIWQFDFWIIPQNIKKEDFKQEEILSWKDVEINISINKFLGSFLKEETSWSKHIKQYGEDDKTCIKFRMENEKIDEISCRLDLRSLSKEELKEVTQFIGQIGGNVYYQGEIYPADFKVLIELLKESEATRFCTNPQRYFEKISDVL